MLTTIKAAQVENDSKNLRGWLTSHKNSTFKTLLSCINKLNPKILDLEFTNFSDPDYEFNIVRLALYCWLTTDNFTIESFEKILILGLQCNNLLRSIIDKTNFGIILRQAYSSVGKTDVDSDKLKGYFNLVSLLITYGYEAEFIAFAQDHYSEDLIVYVNFHAMLLRARFSALLSLSMQHNLYALIKDRKSQRFIQIINNQPPAKEHLNKFTPDLFCYTVYMAAREFSAFEDILRYLSPLFRPEDYDNKCWSPMHWAMLAASEEVVTFLLEQGWDINCQTQWGETPAHVLAKVVYPKAQKKGLKERVLAFFKYVIQLPNFDPLTVDNFGNSAYHFAAATDSQRFLGLCGVRRIIANTDKSHRIKSGNVNIADADIVIEHNEAPALAQNITNLRPNAVGHSVFKFAYIFDEAGTLTLLVNSFGYHNTYLSSLLLNRRNEDICLELLQYFFINDVGRLYLSEEDLHAPDSANNLTGIALYLCMRSAISIAEFLRVLKLNIHCDSLGSILSQRSQTDNALNPFIEDVVFNKYYYNKREFYIDVFTKIVAKFGNYFLEKILDAFAKIYPGQINYLFSLFNDVRLTHLDSYLKNSEWMQDVDAERHEHLKVLQETTQFQAALPRLIRFAARRGNNIFIRDFGASDPAVAKDSLDSYSPLHYAVLVGEIETIKELLALGWNINTRSAGGETPWLLAVKVSDAAFLQELAALPDIDVLAEDSLGNNALHYAAFAKEPEREVLLSIVCNACQQPWPFNSTLETNLTLTTWHFMNLAGDTVLHYAAAAGNFELVEAFHEALAEPFCRDSHGYIFLHYPVLTENLIFLKRFFADVLLMRDSRVLTVLDELLNFSEKHKLSEVKGLLMDFKLDLLSMVIIDILCDKDLLIEKMREKIFIIISENPECFRYFYFEESTVCSKSIYAALQQVTGDNFDILNGIVQSLQSRPELSEEMSAIFSEAVIAMNAAMSTGKARVKSINKIIAIYCSDDNARSANNIYLYRLHMLKAETYAGEKNYHEVLSSVAHAMQYVRNVAAVTRVTMQNIYSLVESQLVTIVTLLAKNLLEDYSEVLARSKNVKALNDARSFVANYFNVFKLYLQDFQKHNVGEPNLFEFYYNWSCCRLLECYIKMIVHSESAKKELLSAILKEHAQHYKRALNSCVAYGAQGNAEYQSLLPDSHLQRFSDEHKEFTRIIAASDGLKTKHDVASRARGKVAADIDSLLKEIFIRLDIFTGASINYNESTSVISFKLTKTGKYTKHSISGAELAACFKRVAAEYNMDIKLETEGKSKKQKVNVHIDLNTLVSKNGKLEFDKNNLIRDIVKSVVERKSSQHKKQAAKKRMGVATTSSAEVMSTATAAEPVEENVSTSVTQPTLPVSSILDSVEPAIQVNEENGTDNVTAVDKQKSPVKTPATEKRRNRKARLREKAQSRKKEKTVIALPASTTMGPENAGQNEEANAATTHTLVMKNLPGEASRAKAEPTSQKPKGQSRKFVALSTGQAVSHTPHCSHFASPRPQESPSKGIHLMYEEHGGSCQQDDIVILPRNSSLSTLRFGPGTK